jgi:hypothetical protein
MIGYHATVEGTRPRIRHEDSRRHCQKCLQTYLHLMRVNESLGNSPNNSRMESSLTTPVRDGGGGNRPSPCPLQKLCLKWRQTRVSSVAIWATDHYFSFIMVINFPFHGRSSCLLQSQSTDLKLSMRLL